MASILRLDMEMLYCSVRFSEADSGMSGRRASVLQALLSAYVRPADFIRRFQLIYVVSEDRTHDLRIMTPTRCQLRYHRPVHLPESPMLGLQGLDHHGAWQTEFGLTREVCVCCCSDFRKILWQVGSASIRGVRFPFSLVGINVFVEQSLSRYAVGEAWALHAINCASTALLVCPIRRWWVPGLPGVGHAGGAMRK